MTDNNIVSKERLIITLCGSTKFKQEFEDARFWLTIQGHIVLTVGGFHHNTDDENVKRIIMQRKAELDSLHKDKIDLGHAIMVIDIQDYIGESTKSEIQTAITHGKTTYSYTHSKLADPQLSQLIECDYRQFKEKSIVSNKNNIQSNNNPMEHR